MGESSGGVPAWVVSGIICLLLSIAGTYMYLTMWLDYKTGPTIYETQADASARQGKEGSQAPGTPKAKGDMNEPGPKGDLLRGARGERPSKHVVTLVEVIDTGSMQQKEVSLEMRGYLRIHARGSLISLIRAAAH